MTEEVSEVAESRLAQRRRKAANLAHSALSLAPKRWSKSTVLVLSFVAFVAVSLPKTSIPDLAILVGVLVFHEAGHMLGMRLFGFSDLRMFFLPFLGAAVSGRKPGASAAERAIVSLLGPVPGLLLALPLAFVADLGSFPEGPLPWMASLVLMLVVVNGFNLLPILPLDGGRLFQTLLFGRIPAVDVLFQVLAIGAIGWLAYSGHRVFWVLAFLMFASLRIQAKIAFEAARLRRTHSCSADPAALGDAELVDLHDGAQRATKHLVGTDAQRKRVLEQAIRDLFDRVAEPRARWWQTVLLLLVWLLAIGVGCVALFVMFRSNMH